jgi:hypothetical protein
VRIEDGDLDFVESDALNFGVVSGVHCLYLGVIHRRKFAFKLDHVGYHSAVAFVDVHEAGVLDICFHCRLDVDRLTANVFRTSWSSGY